MTAFRKEEIIRERITKGREATFVPMCSQQCAISRERDRMYHDELYSGPAQLHFSSPAVIAFRQHLVRRILRQTAANKSSRILSIGCGIGDTEILIAPHVREIFGIDLSQSAIRTARDTAKSHGIRNVTFRVAPWEYVHELNCVFDVVLSIFFLHHLHEAELPLLPRTVRLLLGPGGLFYALEPSANRLSGLIGEALIPNLMKKYQTPDERPLVSREISGMFEQAHFRVQTNWYDFCSTPIAGVLPGCRAVYRLARMADDVLIRLPGVRAFSSNFELIAI